VILNQFGINDDGSASGDDEYEENGFIATSKGEQDSDSLRTALGNEDGNEVLVMMITNPKTRISTWKGAHITLQGAICAMITATVMALMGPASYPYPI